MTPDGAATAGSLERELEALLQVEKFPPPEEFREQALITDMSLHEEAERDLEGFWAGRPTSSSSGSPSPSRRSTSRPRRSTSGSRAGS